MKVPSGIVILAVAASVGGVFSWLVWVDPAPDEQVPGTSPAPREEADPEAVRTPVPEPAVSGAGTAPSPAVQDPSQDTGIFDAMNAQRADRSVPLLERDGTLDALARNHARDMAARGYFDHTSPDGTTFAVRIGASGFVYGGAAENIGLAGSWSAIVPNWMGSEGHRNNILNAEYRWAGAGTAAGTYEGQPVVYAVAVFAAPR